MRVTTIGLDLAKNIFQVHGVTADGTTLFNRPVPRAQLLKFFEKQPLALLEWRRAPQAITGPAS